MKMVRIKPQKPTMLNYERQSPGRSLYSGKAALAVAAGVGIAGVGLMAIEIWKPEQHIAAPMGAILVGLAIFIWHLEREES
jgi:hypothetical protein